MAWLRWDPEDLRDRPVPALCLTLAGTGSGQGGGPWPPLFPIPTHQGGTSPRVSCEIGDLGRHGGWGGRVLRKLVPALSPCFFHN